VLAGGAAGRPAGISRRLAAIVFIPAAAAVLISVPFILGHGRAAAARARARQLPFSAPGWTVPACHRAGLSRHSAGRRLRVT